MSKLPFLVLSLFPVLASADPMCGVLARWNGHYVQIANSCAPHDRGLTAYPSVEVRSIRIDDEGRAGIQTWLAHNGKIGKGGGFHPSTRRNDGYQCVVTGNTLTVRDEAGHTHTFQGDEMKFSTPTCTAVFKKLN